MYSVTRTVNGTYGRGTPCRVFVLSLAPFARWYCVEGSKNVNLTPDEITSGVDVEVLADVDTFTNREEIHSVEDLYDAVMYDE
jgi:hypothetical protein